MKYTSRYRGWHRCPFYDHEYISTINCEGIGTAKENIMRFSTEEDKYRFMESHCLKEFPSNCPLFEVLWEQNTKDEPI